ncbi:MAG: 16S rRNA (guanine(966)-N(2))-methyltransferase RsmD [Thermoleophilia bacterium]
MRVVGGEWRGRPLAAPAGRTTRPTSDKVREAIFAVLLALPEVAAGRAPGAGGPLAGQRALDLFAGSGALGIEALSRGAESCTFVESDRGALGTLRANLERLGVPVARGRRPTPPATTPRARVLAGDARRVLPADARRGERYTLVFADPPYDRAEELLPALTRLLLPVLAERAVLVVETAAGATAGLPGAALREKRYGDTQVRFTLVDGLGRGHEETADDDSPAI